MYTWKKFGGELFRKVPSKQLKKLDKRYLKKYGRKRQKLFGKKKFHFRIVKKKSGKGYEFWERVIA